MKKKLLFSSVAALTLFATYNTTASAASVYGSDVDAVNALLNASAENPAPVAPTVTQEQINQVLKAATDLRVSNRALEAAKKTEASAKANFDKAQAERAKAAADLRAANDGHADEEALKLQIKDAQEVYQGKKDTADAALKDASKEGSEAFLNTKKDAVKEKQTAVDTAQAALDKVLAEKEPVRLPNETDEQYKAELDKFNKEVAEKRVALNGAKEELAKAKEDEAAAKKAFDENTKVAKENEENLAKLQKALDAIAAKKDFQQETVKAFEDVLKAKTTAVADAETAYLKAGTDLKTAQSAYAAQLKTTKAKFDEYKVPFNEAEVLAPAVEQPEVTKAGWVQTDAGWTFQDSKGVQVKGQWVNDGGKWYLLGQDGLMKKWWNLVDGKWYFLNGSGAMETGWLLDNGKWYFLEASGAMKASQWFEVNGKWYYVNASGELAVNTTVNGYTVNGNGEWVK